MKRPEKLKEQTIQRNAGILLHITSLPSEFGIGDFGPGAYAFADILDSCDQRIWQLLPLNPVDVSQGFSPYSSISSRAGNTLLISPELLVKEQLIDAEKLAEYHCPDTGRVDFQTVIQIKDQIFDHAWMNFREIKDHPLKKYFTDFCAKEKGWLDDFAIYISIKAHQQNKPWFQWPEALKKRRAIALRRIRNEYKDEITKTKFLQFIFSRQWEQLKFHCNSKGIKIFGDLPIYVSHDSADVWANHDIFIIDNKGDLVAVAGTPPDLFSSEGQLWGMPVFKWEVLKKKNYAWWLDRLKKNFELFDIIRLDHFRGFSAYWEVPASSGSSKNGEWQPGPGADLFETIRMEFKKLPFVAEDLGDIDEDVIRLRNQFGFPGMKVLQFAFQKNMAKSIHTPHNYSGNSIVYTGTHDNNTTRGWYKSTDEDTRKRVQQYCGKELSEQNIADELIRLAYSSVANTAIVPLQDFLNLDESARMNTPSGPEDNWNWRFLSGQCSRDVINKIKELTLIYNRNVGTSATKS
jgi:4-alpha-glucanotransferase